MTDFKPAAVWRPDCQGKTDFDGRLLSISSRTWPPRYDSTENYTGHSHIFIDHNVEYIDENNRDHFESDYTVLAQKLDFAAPTYEDLQSQIEEWVAEQCRDILVRLSIALPLPGDGLPAVPAATTTDTKDSP